MQDSHNSGRPEPPSPAMVLAELLVRPDIRQLFEGFARVIGANLLVVAADGRTLLSTNQHSACDLFHRRHPQSRPGCQKTDAWLVAQAQAGARQICYHPCPNGLGYSLTPVHFGQRYAGNLCLGQFLTAPPDEAEARRRAKELGFDEQAYLQAVRTIPVIAPERLPAILDYLGQLAQTLASLAEECRRAREEQSRQMAAAQDELEIARQKFSTIFHANPIPLMLSDLESGRIIEANSACLRLGGVADPTQVLGRSTVETGFLSPEERQRLIASLKENGRIEKMEISGCIKGSKLVVLEYSAIVYEHEGQRLILSSFVDITERKQAETNLRDNERFLNSVIDNIPSLLFVKSADDYRFLRLNPRAAASMPMPADGRLIGKTDYDILPPAKADAFVAKTRQALASPGVTEAPEETIETAQGPRTFHTRLIPIPDDQGKPKYLLAILDDITEQKRSERALQQSERRYRYFVEQTGEGFYRMELDRPISLQQPVVKIVDHLYRHAYIAECNDNYAKMYGRASAASMQGTRLVELYDDNNHPENREALRHFVMADCHMVDVETEETDVSGHTVYLLNNAIGIVENGDLVAIWGTQRDVTGRKLAEIELLDHRENLETLVAARTQELAVSRKDTLRLLQVAQEQRAHAEKAISLYDVSMELSRAGYWHVPVDGSGYYNSAAKTAAIFGNFPAPGWRYRLKEDWLAHIEAADPASAEETQRRFQDALEGKSAFYDTIYPFRRPVDGKVVWIHAIGRCVHDADGRVSEMFGVAQDISGLKRREEELRQAKETAEAASQAKSVFLSNMSHELRTPLNAVLGFAQLVQRDPQLPARHRNNLNIILRSGEHLLKIINDVLEISRIESGKTKLVVRDFDPGRLLNEVMEMFRSQAKPGLAHRLELASSLPPVLRTDPDKIRQILVNLLGNAVKFTQQGEIVLAAEFRPGPGGGGGRLALAVRDTGIGIAEADLRRIFGAFEQAGNQPAQTSGTGLGLAISKQYAEMLKGSISVTSTPGQGSCFRLELPAEAPASAAEAGSGTLPPLLPGQQAWRLMVVEAQPESQAWLRARLEESGFAVAVAGSGENAIGLLSQWRPDLVWINWRLPGIDGIKTMRVFRALPDGKTMKIVGLLDAADRDRAGELRSAGMDDVLSAPLHADDLAAVLSRLLGTRFQGQATGTEQGQEST